MDPKRPTDDNTLSIPLYQTSDYPCPYLPNRTASNLIVAEPIVNSAIYRHLMDAGFRRSGETFYKPQCPSCRACVPMRVDVHKFQPSDSQRRVIKRNRDVIVDIGRPVCDQQRIELYNRYQQQFHQSDPSTPEDYEEFLVSSPIDTWEMRYRIEDSLVAIGIIDETPGALSSVYLYYDPNFAARSLGVFSALHEIEQCKRRGMQYWYPGFYVEGCRKMEYKTRFRPFELIQIGA